MILAASPPLYSSAPCRAAGAAFTDSALRFLPSPAARNTLRSLRQLAMNNNSQNSSNNLNSPKPTAAMVSTSSPATPLRSCLVCRTPTPSSESSPPSSPENLTGSSPALTCHKNKKRVIFADDRGLALTQVKVMTEPSECPPRWSADFLEQVTGGVTADVATPSWDLLFRQPAADYLDFRSRVERQNVCLESCVVQDNVAEPALVGTVKVRNLSYHKFVTLRVSWDSWATFKDYPAEYVQSPTAVCAPGAVNLLDTFSFKIPIPSDDAVKTCQFCLRFNSDANEFWDSNDGKNYELRKQELQSKLPPLPLSPPSDSNSSKRKLCSSPVQRPVDALTGHTPSWEDFSSWNHLLNDGPYW